MTIYWKQSNICNDIRYDLHAVHDFDMLKLRVFLFQTFQSYFEKKIKDYLLETIERLRKISSFRINSYQIH